MAWRKVYRPHVQVLLPRIDRRAWVSDLAVYLSEGAHQVVELTVQHVYNAGLPGAFGDPRSGALWPDSTPVSLRWGWWSDDSADFFGYVASSEVMSSQEMPQFGGVVQLPVRYTLVGASMAMQTRRNRNWPDTTMSAIARQVAAEYNLSPRVETSNVKFEQQMQIASDWTFLSDCADQIGYRLYVDGTTLWFVDRAKIAPTRDGTIPVFHASRVPGPVDTLRDFRAVLGDTDPAGGVRARYQTTSLNRRSGQLALATYTQPRSQVTGKVVAPLLDRQFNDRPSPSYGKAEYNLASQVEWLWVTAQAVTNGDARLRPGTVISLRGSGLGKIHGGYWMVRSAVHRLQVNHVYPEKTTYTCELVLGRNQADRLDLPVQTQSPRPADTVLVNGRWRAIYNSTGETWTVPAGGSA